MTMRNKNSGVQRLAKWVAIGLTVAAVVQELRTPADEREWNGTVAGFVPYDFRMPTQDRVRERLWNPESPRVFSPKGISDCSMDVGNTTSVPITRAPPSTTLVSTRPISLVQTTVGEPLNGGVR